ncbi:hypothetical protein ABK040_011663 [Willaertia magna]
MTDNEKQSTVVKERPEQHVLVDGKIEYELEEICNIKLYGNITHNLSSINYQKTRNNCWEEAPFLKEQNFKTLYDLNKLEKEELQFECEDNLIPKYNIPLSSSSRKDIEHVLNQILNIIKKDYSFKLLLCQLIERILKSSIFKLNKNLFINLSFYFKSLFFDNFNKKENIEKDEDKYNDNQLDESLFKTLLFLLWEEYIDSNFIEDTKDINKIEIKKEIDELQFFLEFSFAFLYLKLKEYNKSEIYFEKILQKKDKFTKLNISYLNLIYSFILRINFKLKESLIILRKIIEMSPFNKLSNMHLTSAIYLWIGDILESLKFYIWSIESYFNCINFYNNHPNINHYFIIIGFVYLKIAEIFILLNKEKNNDKYIIYAKEYYLKAIDSLESKFLKLNKTFIELSPFTRNFNQSIIAIRLGCIYYVEKKHELSEKYFGIAENKLLKYVGEGNSNEEDNYSIVNILQMLHRKIAINYCRLDKFELASKYVTYRLIIKKDNNKENNSYKRQLELMKEEKEREKLEKKTHAKGVIAQDHPICFMALCLIELKRKRFDEAIRYCELLFQIVGEENVMKQHQQFKSLPLLTIQRFISIIISIIDRYDLAQIVLTKVLLEHKDYSLGYYVLFLLSVANRDISSIVGSWTKFRQIQNYQVMEEYWPFVLNRTGIVKLPISKL